MNIKIFFRHPLFPGIALLAILVLLTAGTMLERAQLAPEAPRKLPQDTVAIFEIDSSQPIDPTVLAQTLEALFPELRALHERTLTESKIDIFAAARPFLTASRVILVTRVPGKNPNLVLVVPRREGDFKTTFESAVSRALSRINLSYRPVFLPDHSFVSEQIADPTQFPFYPITITGYSVRTLNVPNALKFALVDKGNFSYFASSLGDLETTLGAFGTQPLNPYGKFVCISPSTGLKIRLRKDSFVLTIPQDQGLTKLFLPYRSVSGNGQILINKVTACG